jgi:putative PIN family toxin of toxin-antitoxin system
VRIVLDTNVIVSGLLSPGGTPGRVLDLLSSRRIIALYDDRMLREYRRVLPLPKLAISAQVIRGTLEFIEAEGLLVAAPPLHFEVPDPDDLAFVEVAVAGDAVALVTGNGRHFAPAREYVSVPILSPAEFIEFWRTAQG